MKKQMCVEVEVGDEVGLTQRSRQSVMRTFRTTALALGLVTLATASPAGAASPVEHATGQGTLSDLKLTPEQWVRLEAGLQSYTKESLQKSPSQALEVMAVLAEVLTPRQRQQLGNDWEARPSAVNSTIYPSLCRVSTKAGLVFSRAATGLCDGSLFTDTEDRINEAASSSAQSALTCTSSNTDPCLWGSYYALAVPYYIATEVYGYTSCRLYTPALLVEYSAYILCGSAN